MRMLADLVRPPTERSALEYQKPSFVRSKRCLRRQSFASFFTVNAVVNFAVSPLALMVVVSNGNECAYSTFTGGLCLKISAASARCLEDSDVTGAAETQTTCPVVNCFFHLGHWS